MRSTSCSQIKVIVGLSGGVDSSVAAYLLKKQGYYVEALFMKNWEEDDTDTYCSAAIDLKDAEAVCQKLDIKLHVCNFSAEYWDRVFEYFIQEYKLGRTPNPDILCNKEVKFKAFLDYACNNLKADYIATGHYARIRKDNESYQLLKACDTNKDQSYFLHALNQSQLSRSIFPVGELTKPEIRAIAKELGLVTHDKKDSTGICFIGEVKFKKFLSKYLPANPGNIIDVENNTIGRHDGLMYYTIGQRQGLNLGGLKNYSELPWYVAQKNLDNNTLLVVQGTDHPLLHSFETIVTNYNFIVSPKKLANNNLAADTQSIPVYIKSRYRQPDQLAYLSVINTPSDSNSDLTFDSALIKHDQLLVKFDTPQRAITPGQAIVFYDYTDSNICLGGGSIS